jgi:hypothetical protein
VLKALLEFSLFVAEAFDLRRDTWWRQMKQNVSTVHPVDMRHHRVKSARGNVFKAQVLLDIFMKQLYCPTESISEYNLACRGSERLSGNKTFITEDLRSYAWQG